MGSRVRATVILVVCLVTAGCAQVFDDVVGGDRGPGSNYEAYLSGDRDLVVELDHSPGAKWSNSGDARAHFVQQLERITAKDVEVRVNNELPSNGEDYAWSTSELRELHQEHRDHETNDDQVVMHALFLEGRYQENNVLGVAFASESFALFKDTIEDVSCRDSAIACPGGEPKEWRVMRAVAIHEAGHLLGLVNSPLPMVEDHEMEQDPRTDTPQNEGDAHSDNEDSVMHWAVRNKRGLTSVFGGGDVPWEFDRYDLQDAEAVRGGSS